MCVTGKGDFSVVIRSIFKWDDDDKEFGKEQWNIGAGGAVTALSTKEGEWDEMLVKLQSTLSLFTKSV
jgi:para-aminobenzoate synthetase